MELRMLFHDLEKLRTPKEMEMYYQLIKTKTSGNNDLTKLARLKKGKYKEFLEEFYPLYCFSKSKHCRNASGMKIVIGNQGYDAVILFSNGLEEHYEITSYVDGEWDYLNGVELNKRGMGIVNVDWTSSILEKQEHYLNNILENAKNKALKDYKNINIIFVVDTFWHFDLFGIESSNFIVEVVDSIGQMGIKAKSIFLLRLNNQDLKEVDSNIFCINNY